ncbi:hypothetical protein B9G55_15670 [Saccharibacillus sp. O16]|nr:hypothetical protein B9G55_15670 [Saccharibacillus sp. O16]
MHIGRAWPDPEIAAIEANSDCSFIGKRSGRNMGLEGTYTALPNEKIRQLADGEASLLEIDQDAHEQLNIGSCWEALHYTLTEEFENGEPPLGYIVPLPENQTIPAGDLDACFLTWDQVNQALSAIQALTDEDFRHLYDFERMQEEGVYTLNGTAEQDRELFLTYLLARLEEIRVFYGRCAAQGNGVIFHLS